MRIHWRGPIAVSVLVLTFLFCDEDPAPTDPPVAGIDVSCDTVVTRYLFGDSVTPTARFSAVLEQGSAGLSFDISYVGSSADWATLTGSASGPDTLDLMVQVGNISLPPDTYMAGITVSSPDGATATCLLVHIVKPLWFSLTTDPIAGFEDVVDAVTKASDVADGVVLNVQEPSPTLNDSIMDVVLDWGDNTPPFTRVNGRYPTDFDYSIGHWFVVDSASGGHGVLSLTVTTYGGLVTDTAVPIVVLTADEH